MSRFSSDWLALREAADSRARSRELVASLPEQASVVFDLGAGTGSNLRWLAPQFGHDQHWTLIDNDKRLFVAARKALRAWAKSRDLKAKGRGNSLVISGDALDCSIEMRELDLAVRLGDLDLPAGCLVTASALLDLVSQSWLEGLVALIAASKASVLWSIIYDGSVLIDPPLEDDAKIIGLLNRHQLTDKGFGPALGPDAWLVARSLLEQSGCSVRAVDSSWHLGANDGALLQVLITGWAEAAISMAPTDEASIRQWCQQRLEQARRRKLEVSVGHRDIAAWPAGG